MAGSTAALEKLAPSDPLGGSTVRRRRAPRAARLGISLALALAPLAAQAAQESDADWRESWETAEARIAAASEVEEIEPIVGAYEARALEGDEHAAWVVYRGAQRLLVLRPDASEAERLELTERLWRGRMGLAEPEKALSLILDLVERRVARGEDDAARLVLEESLRHFPDTHAYLPFLLHPLADLERRQLRWHAALERIDEAEKILAAPPASAPIACALRLLRGQVALEMGLLERAAPLLEEGLAAAEALRAAGNADPGVLVTSWVGRANLRQATRRFRDLIDELEQVLAEEGEILEQRPATRADLLVRLGMARSELALDDPAQMEPARGALTEALEDPAARALARLSAEGLLAQLALHAHDFVEARRWVDAASARLAGRSFAPVEHAFISALAARVTLEDAPPAELDGAWARLSGDVERLLAEWRRQPVREGGVGHLQFDRVRLPIAEAMALALRRDPGERGLAIALELLVRAQAAGSLARALDEREPSWDEVRAALVPPDGGVLVYFPSVEQGHLFAFDRECILHALLPDRRHLAPRVAELEGLLYRLPSGADGEQERARRSEALERLAAQLGRDLLPPEIAARIERWRALTIVGADLLDELPFECLRLPSGASLGRTLAVAHLSSLPTGVALERRARARGPLPFERDLCLVAGAAPSAAAQELHPYISALELEDGERQRLTRAFAAQRTLLLAGPEATPSALEAGAPGTRVLHVFTHGVWDERRERSAGLVLSPDRSHPEGLFFAEDAERLASPPLVVLCACESAVEPVRRGDGGAASLSGAFFRGGADVVVGAVSALSRRAALALMESFQLELAGGASPAEALRRARCALAADPAWDDPAYTDLVRVSGRGHAPVFDAPSGRARVAWFALAALAALALAAFARARRPSRASAS